MAQDSVMTLICRCRQTLVSMVYIPHSCVLCVKARAKIYQNILACAKRWHHPSHKVIRYSKTYKLTCNHIQHFQHFLPLSIIYFPFLQHYDERMCHLYINSLPRDILHLGNVKSAFLGLLKTRHTLYPMNRRTNHLQHPEITIGLLQLAFVSRLCHAIPLLSSSFGNTLHYLPISLYIRVPR